jgi:hypothetical protein
MTAPASQPSGSMRFQSDEVLSGMLATVERPTFTDDRVRLMAIFEALAGRFSLFAHFQSGTHVQAVDDALAKLEAKDFLRHDDGCYTLTTDGRAHCVSSKRTLFNPGDREQLEAAALVFDTL